MVRAGDGARGLTEIPGEGVELSYRIDGANLRAASSILGHVLGAAYESGAFVPDGTPAPEVTDPVADYVPTARPGHRAPHHQLSVNGGRRSTIDLFDGRFVALSTSERWCAAARAAGAARRVPTSAYVIADPAWAAGTGWGRKARCWSGRMATWPGEGQRPALTCPAS